MVNPRGFPVVGRIEGLSWSLRCAQPSGLRCVPIVLRIRSGKSFAVFLAPAATRAQSAKGQADFLIDLFRSAHRQSKRRSRRPEGNRTSSPWASNRRERSRQLAVKILRMTLPERENCRFAIFRLNFTGFKPSD